LQHRFLPSSGPAVPWWPAPPDDAHSGGTKGVAGAVAPPSLVIPLNTYININIYSIRNISFTYFFSNMMIFVRNSVIFFKKNSSDI
jgi:hypothetical protein